MIANARTHGRLPRDEGGFQVANQLRERGFVVRVPRWWAIRLCVAIHERDCEDVVGAQNFFFVEVDFYHKSMQKKKPKVTQRG